MLADAAREHERVDAAQHADERADLAGRAKAEKIDGFARRRLFAGQKFRHIVRDAGNALQPAIVIQHAFDGFFVQLGFAHEVQQNADVESAGTRAHYETFQNRKAHRRVEALPFIERAQTRAVAHVGDDGAAIIGVWDDFFQAARYEFI